MGMRLQKMSLLGLWAEEMCASKWRRRSGVHTLACAATMRRAINMVFTEIQDTDVKNIWQKNQANRLAGSGDTTQQSGTAQYSIRLDSSQSNLIEFDVVNSTAGRKCSLRIKVVGCVN